METFSSQTWSLPRESSTGWLVSSSKPLLSSRAPSPCHRQLRMPRCTVKLWCWLLRTVVRWWRQAVSSASLVFIYSHHLGHQTLAKTLEGHGLRDHTDQEGTLKSFGLVWRGSVWCHPGFILLWFVNSVKENNLRHALGLLFRAKSHFHCQAWVRFMIKYSLQWCFVHSDFCWWVCMHGTVFCQYYLFCHFFILSCVRAVCWSWPNKYWDWMDLLGSGCWRKEHRGIYVLHSFICVLINRIWLNGFC